MEVCCSSCREHYDDVKQWTLCPHKPLRDPATQARWEWGLRIIGNKVRMANMPMRNHVGTCYGLSFDGLVHVEQLPGAYPADMFEIAGEVSAVPMMGWVN